jgi:hypothetical protein
VAPLADQCPGNLAEKCFRLIIMRRQQTKQNQTHTELIETNSARMSEVLSKEAQDAIDRMIRNDPTMTELNLYGERFDFGICLSDC